MQGQGSPVITFSGFASCVYPHTLALWVNPATARAKAKMQIDSQLGPFWGMFMIIIIIATIMISDVGVR